ncbi:MAG: lipid A biosynthesis protein [Acidobacteria bacterium]|nr:lipid A biosynthesis protein [Acidobacteriota bacterium]
MSASTFFVALGFVAQGVFASRFIVQWIASEKEKRSVIPMAFWYLSFSGGLLLTVYAVYRKDPVFILGQASGLIVYTRNIVLRWREARQSEVD